MTPSATGTAIRPCPSSLHSWLLLMSLSLLTFGLLCAPPAQAQASGHYWQITYSNKDAKTTYDRADFTTGQTTPVSLPWGPQDNSGGVDTDLNGLNCNATATVTATLTWIPAAGQTLASDPPSEPVYIQEAGNAFEDTSRFASPRKPPPPVGSADDGLGDSEVPTGTRGYSSDGTHLIHRDGSSGTITLDPVTLTAVVPTSTRTGDSSSGYSWNYLGGVVAVSFYVQLQAVGPLNGTYINKDDPTNSVWEALPTPLVLYGGSIPSTSDELLLDASDSTTGPGTVYTWSSSGPGSYTPPAANSATWNVGPLRAAPGIQTFECTVQTPGQSTSVKELVIEVGIRTDDAILIGWIDPQGVTLPGNGVSSWLTDMFPPAGPPVGTFAQQYEDINILSGLSQNFIRDDNSHDFSSPQVNRFYLLNWLFKYGGNTDPSTIIPLGNFQDITGSYINYPKVNAFVSGPTNYKMFNHLQIKYRTIPDSGTFNGAPVILNRSFPNTAVGTTIDPILKANFPGQHGPNDGLLSIFSDHVSTINDGSPDDNAIKAFNTLVAQDTASPMFWENIGSQIRFKADGTTSPTPIWQNYPTYYEYINGKLVFVNPEAQEPSQHFYSNPYPFGTVPTTGDGGTMPGGRNGDATSAPDPSARIPSYVIP